AKIVGGRRRRIGQRLLLQSRIGIERMLFTLEFFLVGKFFAGREKPVLRLEMCSVRSDGLRLGLAGGGATQATADLADLETGSKTFEVAFLLVGKFDGESVNLHGA